MNMKVDVSFSESIDGTDDCQDLIFPSMVQINGLRKDELAKLRLHSVMNSNGGNYFASFKTNNGWTSSYCKNNKALTEHVINPNCELMQGDQKQNNINSRRIASAWLYYDGRCQLKGMIFKDDHG